MARASHSLIVALRKTAWVLRTSVDYQWGHRGACNCGHLAQTLTSLTKGQIHAAAIERGRDWGELVIDYCPTSGLPIDYIISSMLDAGLTRQELKALEDLSDRSVLSRLPEGRRYLRHNVREDVIIYMNLWADLIEEQLAAEQGRSEVIEDVSPLGKKEAA